MKFTKYSISTKGKSTTTGFQRGMPADEEQFSRVKEPSDMYDTKDHLSR